MELAPLVWLMIRLYTLYVHCAHIISVGRGAVTPQTIVCVWEKKKKEGRGKRFYCSQNRRETELDRLRPWSFYTNSPKIITPPRTKMSPLHRDRTIAAIGLVARGLHLALARLALGDALDPHPLVELPGARHGEVGAA